MAYRIEYSPETAHLYPQRNVRQKNSKGRWVVVTIVIAGLLWLRLNGVPDFLVPGDKEVTRSATTALVEDLKEGNTVGEAVGAFCRTILDGAAH